MTASWMDEARCANTSDPDKFATRNNAKKAPGECAGCPVIEACRNFGEATGSHGWFGGEWMKYREIGVDLDEKMHHLVKALHTTTELALAIGKSKDWVRQWKARNGVGSLTREKGDRWRNPAGEATCMKGHPRWSDTVTIADGHLVCITCEMKAVA